VEGLDKPPLPVDVNAYDMDDNLHMHDLTHQQVGDEGASAGKKKEDR
jgi:C4-dicarboxylate transporter DctQ subunit